MWKYLIPLLLISTPALADPISAIVAFTATVAKFGITKKFTS